jgi:RNA polymerase sigma-70 factor (ECF subfamily)
MAVVNQSPKPLAEIITDLKHRRDASANFRLLFDCYHGQVYRFFERKGMPHEDCRDLSQETFLAAFRKIEDLRDESHFPGWLFSIARSIFYGELDRKHAGKRAGVMVIPIVSNNHPGEPTVTDVPDLRGDSDLLRGLLDKEKLEHVLAAFRDLPRQMCRCLELRIVGGNSYQEIATIMGISINTVKAHLHKAKKELQQRLSPYFDNIEV